VGAVRIAPLTAQQWADFLLAIGPRGSAWLDRTGRVAAMRLGEAGTWARLHEVVAALAREAGINLGDTLTWWESATGLPDPDLPPPATVAERVAEGVSRVSARFWDDPDLRAHPDTWYTALAARWGVAVTIERWADWWCVFGVSSAGTDWHLDEFGTAEFDDSGFGAEFTTDAGLHIARLFERLKRAHALILWRD